MEVTYSGAQGPEVLTYDRGRPVVFEAGKPTEVSDDVGRALVEQSPGLYSSPSVDPSPAKSANKDEWVAFRVAQGWPVDSLDGLTKDELIALPDTPAQTEEN